MASRINFDVDEETQVKIEDVMASTGISTKRRLFEAALDVLARVQRLLHEERVIVAVKANQLDSVLQSAGEGVLIVEQPPGTGPRWLVQRPGGWRSTPWVKGTRVHVSDVVAMLAADPKLTPREIADDLNLPVDAVNECVVYAKVNKALIDAEDREAGLRNEERGDHAPSPR
jgi:uncharacterized protein (DUF433 family)